MSDNLQALAAALRQELAQIPATMRQEEVVRASLVCLLAQAVRGMGLFPVPAWKPPRSTRERIDLVAVDASGELPKVRIAFVVDPLVELPKVKSLEWVDCPEKIYVTFSERADKVKQTTFFLSAVHTHLDLHGDKPPA